MGVTPTPGTIVTASELSAMVNSVQSFHDMFGAVVAGWNPSMEYTVTEVEAT